MITLLTLLILGQGTESHPWSVKFDRRDLCAVKGSSVEFRCSYNYTVEETVYKTAWSKGEFKNGEWARVEFSHLPAIDNRSQYLGDLQHDCSLSIRDLQENDTGYYYFRFDTDKLGWRSRKSVFLTVTDISAKVHPDKVKTGDNVTLECLTSCTDPRIVWFKDGEPLSEPEFPAQPQDYGKYVCAVEGQEFAQSDPVVLNVEYLPLNVSVEVSYTVRHRVNVSNSVDPPSVVAGSSVNLTCSSDANPAAENYTWYWRADATSPMLQVGSGQVLSVPSVEASHTGLYLCQARNQLGKSDSTEVLLTLEEAADTSSRILLVALGVKIMIILLLSVAIIYFWRRIDKSEKDDEENCTDYENVPKTEMSF